VDRGLSRHYSAEIVLPVRILVAATRYADAGLRVLPLNGKRPFIKDWPNEATCDLDVVCDWWGGELWDDKEPTTWNVGIATGAGSGVVVLDVDGDAGEAALGALVAEHGTLPETLTCITGGGGRHLYFRHPGGTVGNSPLATNVDVRADGGQVVAPPSRHPITHKPYRWAAEGAPPADLPSWLGDLVAARPAVAGSAPTEVRGSGSPAYARAALEQEVEAVRTAQEGTRNDALNRAAYNLGQLVGGGLLDEGEVRAALTTAAEACGLGGAEIAATIASGLTKGAAQPRTGPRERPRYTDLGNAIRLVTRHGADLRYCHPYKRWLVWNGNRWLLDETEEHVRRAKDTARAMWQEVAKITEADERKRAMSWAHRSQNAGQLRNMVSLAQSEPGIPVAPDDLDADPWLLGTPNGALDLRTGRLRAAERSDYITKQTTVGYDAEATAPTWDRFLARVLPDADVRRFVQRAVGYSLTGDTSEQVLFLCYGTGANGKSTFIELIRQMLGDYGQQAAPEMLLVKQGGGISNDVARLKGARFVATVETAEGRGLNEALVKQLTGGDTVTARFMHAEFFEFQPVGKLWMATNHRPQIRGNDDGIWRRLRVVPFTERIPEDERDPGLPEKLRAELPGILNWALAGCREWRASGLAAPAIVRAAVEDYRSDMDVVGAFLAEWCTLGDDEWVETKVLYTAYDVWAHAANERPKPSKAFAAALSDRGFQQDRRTARLRGGDGTGRRRNLHVWRGLSVTGVQPGRMVVTGDE